MKSVEFSWLRVAVTLLLLCVCVTSKIALSATPSITGGVVHSCAIDVAGGALCWGDNRHGQLGVAAPSSSPTPLKVQGLPGPVTAIVIGGDLSQTRPAHTCALTTLGGVYC